MIGILGGAFDPIHNGHLWLASEIKRRLQLAEVRLIPVARPVHRPIPAASAADRLAMIQVAVQGMHGIVADDCELARGGNSYTLETLQAIADETGQALVLLLGSDAFAGFAHWRQPCAIAALAGILVATRPGAASGSADELIATVGCLQRAPDAQAFLEAPLGRVLVESINAPDISATQVRTRLGRQDDVTQMIPESVHRIIQQRTLYQGNTL